MNQYLPILFMFIFAGIVVGVFMLLAVLFGPKKPSIEKGKPFECGLDSVGLPRHRFSIRFYVIAMLFLLFDIEMVFLYPWALLFRKLGLFGLIEMMIFIGILVIGLIYAWKKGALEWE